MVGGEVTVVFMETSRWMCHNRSDRFLDQVDAIELYCRKKLQSHPDNHVGIFATGLTGFGSVVEPTQHLSKIMDGVLGFTLVGGSTDLRAALNLARFRCFNLKKEHKKRNLRKRIFLFAGGPVDRFHYYSVELGEMLSEEGIALDVVNYGPQQEDKTHLLSHLVEIANEDNGSGRILTLQNHLYSSLILPLVVEGDRKRRRDDNDDTHGMAYKFGPCSNHKNQCQII
ncbi:26S proteasome non-ATPase regulatory subunit 4 [Tanacetum coccineum]